MRYLAFPGTQNHTMRVQELGGRFKVWEKVDSPNSEVQEKLGRNPGHPGPRPHSVDTRPAGWPSLGISGVGGLVVRLYLDNPQARKTIYHSPKPFLEIPHPTSK